mmetsp:Transcript_19070/g.29257  ORF Transcript_19070/g.29257 Transcript_19070/m.29257 type:complete len:107 (-) Transcript_19070:149-469(-)
MNNELTWWGQERMIKNPVAAKGMQFVNLDFLADLNDIDEFKVKFEKETEKKLRDKWNEIDKSIIKEVFDRFEQVKVFIEEKSTENREEILDTLNAELEQVRDHISD